ncbi:protein kinase [Micromonospora sp. GCM10011542]|uniref:protein kinase domain-containing protein n=1 Tax=Micromonospora sp. GCM10011542 TaxID=3317337 RepID=UPI0036074104
MLTRGVVLGDRYRLDERVATGGMGAVWRGTDILLEREVAVKVLLPSLVADPEFTARFRAEARMLAALRHPGVVAVHDVGQARLDDAGRVDYLVMEYVEGEPLGTWIRRAGRLDPASTMSVVAQAAEALHTAHLAGIVHRDVKPGNLLVKSDGRVVLVDFGIARSRALNGLTAANMVLGTASYMSPEQATGQPVSGATDVYALGAVAYYCLAGKPPFDGDNPLAVALRHAQEEPAPLPAGTPPAAAAVVARAMAKRPADRFGSAADLAEAAAQAREATLASIPVAARPPWALAAPAPTGAPAANSSPPAGHPFAAPGPVPGPTREDPLRTQPAARRRNLLIGAGAAVLMALVAVVAVVALRPGTEPGDARPPALSAESAGLPTDPATAPVDTAPTGTGRPGGTPSATRTASTGPTGAAGPEAPGGGATRAPTDAPSTAPTGTASGEPTPSVGSTAASRPNPYTAAQVCGSGYQVIDSATLTDDGRRRGRVYLLYHSGNGNNCVVTLKDTAVGTRSAAAAYLEVQGRARSTDSGSFEYYAGPVRASAAGACVKWGGSTGGASYASAFEHCG